jgi:aspartate ammonia-lyase
MATAVAIEAHATGRGVYELVLERKLIPAATLAKILQPDQLTRPHGMTPIE